MPIGVLLQDDVSYPGSGSKGVRGKATVAKLDVDANNALAAQFGVMSIPTLVFFKDGKEVKRVIGVRPKSELTRTLDMMIG